MSIFNFNQEELLSFFAVLVRYSVLVAVLPIVGDKVVPAPLKVLLALAFSIVLFPTLVASGKVRPGESAVWGATAGGIIGTIALEVICALILGFTARMIFDSISFGANLMGTFMGFAAASTFDPMQESQTQVVAQIQVGIATLIFLAVDGHHLMLRAALDSYNLVGVGGMAHLKNFGLNAGFSRQLIDLSGQVIRFGMILAAPVAVSLFAVNVAFGVVSKAMPQMNILVLSFGVTALLGLFVMYLTIPEASGAIGNLFSRIGEWMESILAAMVKGV